MKLKPGSRLFAILLSGLLQSPDVAHAGDLVAPDRIGRLDAPKSFSFRVLTVHSNNNAQPKFAAGMAALYEKYAHTHPDWRVNIQLMSLQIPQEHAHLALVFEAFALQECRRESIKRGLLEISGIVIQIPHTPNEEARTKTT